MNQPQRITMPDVLPVPLDGDYSLDYEHQQYVQLNHGNETIISAFATSDASTMETAALGITKNRHTNGELQADAYHTLGISSNIETVIDSQDDTTSYHIAQPDMTSPYYGSDLGLVVTQRSVDGQMDIVSMQLYRSGQLPSRVKQAIDDTMAEKTARRKAAETTRQAELEARHQEVVSVIEAAMAGNPKPPLPMHLRLGKMAMRYLPKRDK